MNSASIIRFALNLFRYLPFEVFLFKPVLCIRIWNFAPKLDPDPRDLTTRFPWQCCESGVIYFGSESSSAFLQVPDLGKSFGSLDPTAGNLKMLENAILYKKKT